MTSTEAVARSAPTKPISARSSTRAAAINWRHSMVELSPVKTGDLRRNRWQGDRHRCEVQHDADRATELDPERARDDVVLATAAHPHVRRHDRERDARENRDCGGDEQDDQRLAESDRSDHIRDAQEQDEAEDRENARREHPAKCSEGAASFRHGCNLFGRDGCDPAGGRCTTVIAPSIELVAALSRVVRGRKRRAATLGTATRPSGFAARSARQPVELGEHRGVDDAGHRVDPDPAPARRRTSHAGPPAGRRVGGDRRRLHPGDRRDVDDAAGSARAHRRGLPFACRERRSGMSIICCQSRAWSVIDTVRKIPALLTRCRAGRADRRCRRRPVASSSETTS